MRRRVSRGSVVALLFGSIVGVAGCGGADATDPPKDQGKDPKLQKAMGDYMNKVGKPPGKAK